MKKLFILLGFILISFVGFSQTSNERIKELEKEIDSAVVQENFKYAASLNDEKHLLINFDAAILEKDYHKAADIKEKLDKLQPINKLKKEQNLAIEQKNVTRVAEIDDEIYRIQNNITKEDKYKQVTNTSRAISESGIFFDVLPGVKYQNSNGESGIALRLGTKWYFRNNRKYKPGIEATFIRIGSYNLSSFYLDEGILSILDDLSFNDDKDIFHLCPGHIGFSNLYTFSDNSGIEFTISFGGKLSLDDFFDKIVPMGSLNLKYRYKKLAVGFDFVTTQGYYSVIANSYDHDNSYYDYDTHSTIYTKRILRTVYIPSISIGIKL